MTAQAAEAGIAAASANDDGGGSSVGGLVSQAIPKPKGVLLAIAIVLLWLAGLAFFIALEGSRLLAEQATPDGAGFFQALIKGMGAIVQTRAAGPNNVTGPADSTGGG